MPNVVGESSSSNASKPKYSPEVFLSFAGKDTRYGFTSHLYSALQKKGIKTFRDDKSLRKGQPFAPELLEAIEESKIWFIVISEGYYFSKWCLNELVKILECSKKENRHVFPIFYKLEPSEVRNKTRFEEAMKMLNEKQIGNNKPEFSAEKMEEWGSALSYVGSLEGYHLQERFDESEFIERIVNDVNKLVPKHLAAGQHIVGHKTRIQEVMSLLHIGSDDIVIKLLIHGTGGIGKTTLAIALFNEIVNQFEGACFLSSVGEISQQAGGLASLQKKLLEETLGEEIGFGSDDEGASKTMSLLRYKKILLILDDVDEKKQVEKLMGEVGEKWFGFGSRIIITSRDAGLLNRNEVGTITYKMEKLNGVDALEYFCWNAFNNGQPPKGFEKFSDQVVQYANGLPLALKVIGSDLRARESMEWEHALRYYEKNQHRNIQHVLKRSYKGLDKNEKSIFLDIACFFRGKKKEYVEILLECEHIITSLSRKSLITIKYGILEMHDVIQQMGREIAKKKNNTPGKRKRLWHHEDVAEALTEDMVKGRRNIKGIVLDSNNAHREKLCSGDTSFNKMRSLQILMLTSATFSKAPTQLPNNLGWLEWDKYSATLPLDFIPNRLVVLDLPRSQISEFRIKPLQGEYLSRLNLSFCILLNEIPNMLGFPNIRELILAGCKNLTKVDDSVGLCSKLVHLDLSKCSKLKIFPRKIKMPSLEYIDLCFCKSLRYFPDIEGEINTLQALEFVHVHKIKKLPESINKITGLKVLSLSNCLELEELPVFKFERLETVKLSRCPRVSFRKFQTMQESIRRAIDCPGLRQLSIHRCNLSDDDVVMILSCFLKLKCLNLPGSTIESIPACIEECADLRVLDVSFCFRLERIPKLPSKLQKVNALGLPLTTESRNVLWSQAWKEIDGLEIMFSLPKTETSIPSGFHLLYKCGRVVTFQTGHKFPFVAFAFVRVRVQGHSSQMTHSYHDDQVQMFINGHLVNAKGSYVFNRGRRVLLVDLRNSVLQAFLVHDRNNVEVRVKRCSLGCDENLDVYGVPCHELQTNTSSVWCHVPTLPEPESGFEIERSRILKRNYSNRIVDVGQTRGIGRPDMGQAEKDTREVSTLGQGERRERTARAKRSRRAPLWLSDSEK